MLAVEAEFPMAKRFELFTGSKSVRNISLYEKLGYIIFMRKQLSELVELVLRKSINDDVQRKKHWPKTAAVLPSRWRQKP
jgi:hypothetical protein